jgi:hypothetical protein
MDKVNCNPSSLEPLRTGLSLGKSAMHVMSILISEPSIPLKRLCSCHFSSPFFFFRCFMRGACIACYHFITFIIWQDKIKQFYSQFQSQALSQCGVLSTAHCDIVTIKASNFIYEAPSGKM